MRDPFKITGPAVISFSGGRTSGYMLWRIIQAHGGKLPDDVRVVFCNTGKERHETLDFVERCSCEWGVPIVWLEYRTEAEHNVIVVDYATASRCGEPFAELIERKQFLPNAVMRFCTQWLKIKANNRFVRHRLGWAEYENAIGLRADEPRRVAKARNPNKETSPGETVLLPRAEAGLSEADVFAFWKAQPFDLQLERHEGNCDLCFLKGAGKLERILRDRPDLADWWIGMESRSLGLAERAARFRKDRPGYAALLARSQRESLPMMDDDEPDLLGVACHCTD